MTPAAVPVQVHAAPELRPVEPRLKAVLPQEAQGGPVVRHPAASAPVRPAPSPAKPPAPPAKVATAPVLKPPTPEELSDVARLWNRVEQACGGNRRLEVLLEDMQLRTVENGKAVVVVDPKMLSAARSTSSDLAAALGQAFGRTLTLELLPAEVEAAAPTEPEKPRTNMHEHPLVKQAIELFAARVINVGPRQKP